MNLTKILAVVAASLVATVANAGWQKSGAQHWRNLAILRPIVQLMAIDNQTHEWQPWATGVLVDIDTTSPSIYLITNRHVLVNRDSLLMEWSQYDVTDSVATFQRMRQVVSTRSRFVYLPSSEDSDFAAIEFLRPGDSISWGAVKPQETEIFDNLEYCEVVEFYGYPAYQQFGLASTDYHLPVARSGSISYFATEDIYFGDKKFMVPRTFLIDGVSIGGNSGGPVYIRRPFVTASPSGALTVTYDRRLIGIISKHYPYLKEQTIPLRNIPLLSKQIESIPEGDTLFISVFTKDAVSVYEENADLAVVYSIDMIVDYVKRVESAK